MLAASAAPVPPASTTAAFAALLLIAMTLLKAPCLPGPGFMVTVNTQLPLGSTELMQPEAVKSTASLLTRLVTDSGALPMFKTVAVAVPVDPSAGAPVLTDALMLTR